jgi:UDPglucose 6-dehydrogenase
VRLAGERGVPLDVLSAVESANERQKRVLVKKIRAALGGELKGRRIALWGLAFKAGTDDMREAPSLTLIDALLDEGVSICAHDPAATDHARALVGNRIDYAETNYEALEGADALVVVTDWNEYRHPDFARVKRTLKQPVIVDGRNLYDVEKMRELGVRYVSIGRPSS